MGKRKSEQAAGAAVKFHVPRTIRRLQEDLGDGDREASGPAVTSSTDSPPEPQGQASGGSAATDTPGSPSSVGEAAAGENRAGKRGTSPAPQEGGEVGTSTALAAAPGAASAPESLPRADSVADEAGEDSPAATMVQGDASEELDAETPTAGGTGESKDGPEGSTGTTSALPGDAPGRSSGSAPPVEEAHGNGGAHGSKPVECQDAAGQSQEPLPASAVNADGTESGAGSPRAAGAESRDNGEQPQAAAVNAAGEDVAKSWCSPASGGDSTEDPGVCAAPEGTGTAVPTVPVSQSDTSRGARGVAGTGQEEAGGAEPSTAGASTVPVLADPPGEGLVDPGASAPTPEPQLPVAAPTGTTMLAPHGTAAGTEEQLPVPAAVGRCNAKEVLVLAEGPVRAEAPRGPPRSPDASDVVCGLIQELSRLNRLAMGTHRGLEALRRPKLRQSRWPGTRAVLPRPGSRWKET